ncbi:MAG: hypothetical protein WBM35_15810 [Candidatus Electrothrix sp.]
MSLILFKKGTTLFGNEFKAEVAYDVQPRLRDKFVGQMGIAADVEDAEIVEDNPMADFDFDSIRQGTVSKPPVSAAEDFDEETETESGSEDEDEGEATPKAELKHLGGPWWDVVDPVLGTKLNTSALKKADAEALVEELNTAAGSTADEDENS